jgi:hypothetical protein
MRKVIYGLLREEMQEINSVLYDFPDNSGERKGRKFNFKFIL